MTIITRRTHWHLWSALTFLERGSMGKEPSADFKAVITDRESTQDAIALPEISEAQAKGIDGELSIFFDLEDDDDDGAEFAHLCRGVAIGRPYFQARAALFDEFGRA
jgi:hypothetical protein